jgi:hypothetical protein
MVLLVFRLRSFLCGMLSVDLNMSTTACVMHMHIRTVYISFGASKQEPCRQGHSLQMSGKNSLVASIEPSTGTLTPSRSKCLLRPFSIQDLPPKAPDWLIASPWQILASLVNLSWAMSVLGPTSM